tara:strand:- start:2927 stop:3202 length:276 start_codon:yes stop_codon:yes gene_type:complete
MGKLKYGKSNKLPHYSPSNEENDAYLYCVRNNIRICTIPVKNEIGLWYIGVNIGPYVKGEKINLSPQTYDKYNVYQNYYKFCKYYYDKRKK